MADMLTREQRPAAAGAGTMTAARNHGPRDYRLGTVSNPPPGRVMIWERPLGQGDRYVRSGFSTALPVRVERERW